MTSRPFLKWFIFTMMGTSAMAVASAGESAGERAAGPRVPALPLYKQECAGCHVAYPPGLLPAPSWERIMSNLPNHFGTDASMDAAQVRQIATWLARAAGPARQAPPEDRITRSAWFLHEHDELPAAVWKRPSVRGPSNCAACHTRADEGDFRERNIRIPR